MIQDFFLGLTQRAIFPASAPQLELTAGPLVALGQGLGRCGGLHHTPPCSAVLHRSPVQVQV